MSFNFKEASRYALAVALTMQAGFVGNRALAQDGGDAAESGNSDVIIVTAQKREQDLQSVPASVGTGESHGFAGKVSFLRGWYTLLAIHRCYAVGSPSERRR